MSFTAVALTVTDLVVRVMDQAPKDEDVKAGWTAFVIFLLLIGAVAVLGYSLTKHLRKAEAAKDAGVFGDQPPAEDVISSEPAEPTSPDSRPTS